mgnify:FL=1
MNLLTASGKHHYDRIKNNVNGILANIWDTLMMPLLFSFAATNIKLPDLFSAEFFPKALACAVSGLPLRGICAFFCTFGQPYSMPQRGLVTAMWLAKATAQVSLMSLVYNTALTYKGADQEYYLHAGKQIERQAALMVCLCAPLGAIAIATIGPRVLRHDSDPFDPAAETTAAPS